MVKSIEAIDVEVRGLLWKIIEFFQTGETEDPTFEAEVSSKRACACNDLGRSAIVCDVLR
jgi:hypothetical protein